VTGRAGWAVVIGFVVLIVAGGVTARVVAGDPAARGAPEGAPQAVPAAGAGATAVQLSADAAAHPMGAAVRAQLQRYFDAINAGDYAAWQETVAAGRADQQPAKAWKDAYRTTKDGTIRIDRIDDEPGEALLVRVRFTSTQAVSDAPAEIPAERICWRSTLPMDGAPPRIETTRSGSSVNEVC
jgi:hypothetical protein